MKPNIKRCQNCVFWRTLPPAPSHQPTASGFGPGVVDGYVLSWTPRLTRTLREGESAGDWGVCEVTEKEDELFLGSGEGEFPKPFRPKDPRMRLTTVNWCSLETHRTHYCGHWKRVSLKVML